MELDHLIHLEAQVQVMVEMEVKVKVRQLLVQVMDHISNQRLLVKMEDTLSSLMLEVEEVVDWKSMLVIHLLLMATLLLREVIQNPTVLVVAVVGVFSSRHGQ